MVRTCSHSDASGLPTGTVPEPGMDLDQAGAPAIREDRAVLVDLIDAEAVPLLDGDRSPAMPSIRSARRAIFPGRR
jgi:hypothetical protein